jgi:hypothetical protein
VAYVNLGLEFFDRLNGAWERDHLATFELLALNSTEKGTHVVTSLSL